MISRVAHGTTAKVASGNLSPGAPANGQTADLWLCFIWCNATTATTMDAAWTSVFNVSVPTSRRFQCFSFPHAGSTPVLTVTNTSGGAATAFIVGYRPTNGRTLTVDTSSTQTNTAGTTLNYPTVTPAQAAERCVFAWGVADSGTNGVVSGTDPVPLEQLDDTDGVNNTSIGYDDGVASTSAATGARTSTWGGISGADRAGATVLLKETGTATGIWLVSIGTTATGVNCAPSLPANLQQGDLLLCFSVIGTSGTAAQILPGPWISVYNQIASGGVPTLRGQGWWTFYGSATMPTTINTQATSARAVIVAYRGAGGVDAATTSGTGAAGTTITFPTANPLHVNDMCVFVWHAILAGSNGAISGTDPVPVEQLDEASLLGFADGIHTTTIETLARTSTFTTSTGLLGATILLFEDNTPSTTSVIDLPPNQRWV